MANEIRELISQNIKTTLEGVTVGNGYANTLATVERLRQSGQTKLEKPYALIMEGDRETSEQPLAGSALLRSSTLKYIIEFGTWLDDDVASPPLDALLTSLEADIEKALMVDPFRGAWPGGGGPAVTNADTTRITAVTETIVEDGQLELCRQMTVEVDYRHRADDPRALV